ncbi:ADP-ribosylglycohydrolase family protein [Streptomyces sp. NPDC006422]|uniref:ADP-ribosylglycohydrolase family protein n=1 Tax=unclassified Streptomyces TaxID=2593676 RepID=UPI00339E193C
MPSTPDKRPATGALIGSAIGDALGQPTEFLSSVTRIEAEFGEWRGMRLPVRYDGVAVVTDDTEMTLAVARALRQVQEAGGLGRSEVVTGALVERFGVWLDHPGIAPGNTCMQACRALRKGTPWAQATLPNSKGCGANMRVAPVALVPGLVPHQRALIAQLQSALTHGHPTALAASDLTAYAIRLLAHGTAPALLPELLISYARASVLSPPPGWGQWLGELAPQGPGYLDGGWQECIAVLERLAAAAAPGGVDPEADPCLATGEGWIAEEALATGLLCFLLFPDDPVTAVRRAACTSGDSDSIAALAGAFAGAHHGIAGWPPEWIAQVEHSAELLTLGGAWDEVA